MSRASSARAGARDGDDRRAPATSPHPVAALLAGAALALLAGPAMASHLVRPAALVDVEVHRDVPYAAPDRDLTLDVYVPRGGAKPAPVLLFFHGGGWIGGDKADAIPESDASPHFFPAGRSWPSMLPFLQRGLAVVSVRYRLAPAWPAPAALDDGLRALRWLAERGADYGLDPSRIVTIGPSAGGHLALLVAFTYGAEPRADAHPAPGPAPRIVGVVDLYGVTDVGDLLAGPNRREFAEQWVPAQQDRAQLARRMSPLEHVRPGVPPVLVIHSETDAVVPIAHAQRLARALAAAGVAVELVTLPEAVHGFFSPGELVLVERAILDFLSGLKLVDAGAAGQPAAPGPAPTAR